MKLFNHRKQRVFASNIDIFISHSSKDQAIVEQMIELINDLFEKKLNIRCTSVVRYKIEPGKHIENQIKEDILNAKLVIVLLSKDSLGSGHVQNEIGGAWILNKAWVLLHYEDDIRDQLKSFVKNYELTPIYDSRNLDVLFNHIKKVFNLTEKISDKKANYQQLLEAIKLKIEVYNKELIPFPDCKDNILKSIYNYIYYREYYKAYHEIKKKEGYDLVYRLIKDLYFAKNVSSKFRISRQEEDEERMKILKLLKCKIVQLEIDVKKLKRLRDITLKRLRCLIFKIE